MSSHRESPGLLGDPDADNTDLYAFRDPVKPTHVTLISNWIPFEEPGGGPNFHQFDDHVLYEIMIDNDGDGVEDITYQWRFKTDILGGDSTFLYNFPSIGVGGDGEYTGLNVKQHYSLTKVLGPRRKGTPVLIAESLRVAPANVGATSTSPYPPLAAAATYTPIPGTDIDAFAGPRDEGFFLNLGQIFDLLGITKGIDFTSGYNVHSVALRVPITELTKDGSMPTDRDDDAAVLGIWTSASRQKGLVRDKRMGTQVHSGPFVQVSRLGNPLINEVIIPRGKKDFWNAQDPKDDSQFVGQYLEPGLAGALNLVFGLVPAAPTTGREDLKIVLLTGIPALPIVGDENLNFTGTTLADLLRLNVAISPSGSPSPFGVFGGDLAGFPNGRRVTDDVTDIAIRAVRGEVLQLLGALGPNVVPPGALSDGSQVNDASFLTDFPWLGLPHSGSSHVHTHS